MSIPEDFPITTDVVASGITSGINWVAARAPLYEAVNGYIRLPDGHPWLEAETLEEIENCVPWGTFTYGSGNWLGFDTLHAGQTWPGEVEYFTRRSLRAPAREPNMTPEKVIGWLHDLAREAASFIDNGTYSI